MDGFYELQKGWVLICVRKHINKVSGNSFCGFLCNTYDKKCEENRVFYLKVISLTRAFSTATPFGVALEQVDLHS